MITINYKCAEDGRKRAASLAGSYSSIMGNEVFVLVFCLFNSSSGVTLPPLRWIIIDNISWVILPVLLHSVICGRHGVTTVLNVCVLEPTAPDSSVSAVVANITEEERLRQLLCLGGKHVAPRHMLFILSHYCARFIHTLPHKYQCSQMSIQNLYIIFGTPAMCCGCHC